MYLVLGASKEMIQRKPSPHGTVVIGNRYTLSPRVPRVPGTFVLGPWVTYTFSKILLGMSQKTTTESITSDFSG
jgi:hypothetical protein